MAVVAGSPGTAQASDYGYIHAHVPGSLDDGPVVGTLRFVSDGDRIRVCDSRRDGRAVHAYVFRPQAGMPVTSVSARGGYGTCAETDANDYNLRDGSTYEFRGRRTNDPLELVFYDQA